MERLGNIVGDPIFKSPEERSDERETPLKNPQQNEYMICIYVEACKPLRRNQRISLI